MRKRDCNHPEDQGPYQAIYHQGRNDPSPEQGGVVQSLGVFLHKLNEALNLMHMSVTGDHCEPGVKGTDTVLKTVELVVSQKVGHTEAAMVVYFFTLLMHCSRFQALHSKYNAGTRT